jgi:hypothetical protein
VGATVITAGAQAIELEPPPRAGARTRCRVDRLVDRLRAQQQMSGWEVLMQVTADLLRAPSARQALGGDVHFCRGWPEPVFSGA